MMSERFESRDVKLDLIADVVPNACDLLICSASYETRCLSIPLKLAPESVRSVIVLKNSDVAGNGNIHAQTIVDHFGENASIVETTKQEAIRTADLLAQAIQSHLGNGKANIHIDITAMTHETLLILFRLLAHLSPDNHKNAVYLYNPAEEYDPGTPYEDKWLSKGVGNVRSILGFSGKLLPSRKNHLLVLVGFEVNRASGLIDVFEPSSLSLGYGDQSSFTKNHRTVNEQKYRRLRARYPRATKFEFSPRDAFSVRDLVVAEAHKHNQMNLIVAPMNTKISTLGCALAALEMPEIQLCYASAITYNFNNYSETSNNCVVFTC